MIVAFVVYYIHFLPLLYTLWALCHPAETVADRTLPIPTGCCEFDHVYSTGHCENVSADKCVYGYIRRWHEGWFEMQAYPSRCCTTKAVCTYAGGIYNGDGARCEPVTVLNRFNKEKATEPFDCD